MVIQGSTGKRWWALAAGAILLLSCAAPGRAGWVEDRADGNTVIHVVLWDLPDPHRTDTYTRAEVAGVKAFKRRFGEIFRQRYRDRYKARPDVYGRHDWDKVQVELHQFSGITVEGVENDLLAIAGGMAPDVLYVNFRKSDNYIQNSFLYPLDTPADGYLTGMTKQQIDFRIHEKIWPVIRRRGPSRGYPKTELVRAAGAKLTLAPGQVVETGGRKFKLPNSLTVEIGGRKAEVAAGYVTVAGRARLRLPSGLAVRVDVGRCALASEQTVEIDGRRCALRVGEARKVAGATLKLVGGRIAPADGESGKLPVDLVIEREGERLRLTRPRPPKQVWAIPYGGALGKVLLYRKDLFDEKNIPYPDKNWTWDDLLTAARKITDPSRGIYGIQLGRGKHESWYWVTFLWSAGGEVMTYDEQTDQWRCVFGTREAAVALDLYTRLSAEKWLDENGKIRRGYAYKEAEGTTKWDRGEIGMRLDYIDEKLFSTINPELTGMAPVPLGPTGKRGAELNSRMMGLFSEIKHPAVRDAAWEYIRFYDSEEAMGLKTRLMVEGGLGRFVNPRYLRMFGYPEVERLAPKGWSEIFEIAIDTGKPEPYGRNSNYAYDMMTFPIQEAEQLALNDRLPADPNERLDKLHELLEAANNRANYEMIGIIPPEQRRLRDALAIVVLVAIVVVFGLVFRYIIRKFTPPEAELGRKTRWGFWRYRWAYLLLVPAVATILVWRYVPLARGSVMAFQDYRIIGESAWVWVRNFGDTLFNQEWWQSVWNSIRLCLLVVSLTFLPPIVLAILLQEVPRGRLLFRTIFYLPAVITGLVTILLWKQFYDPSEHGVLNALVLRIPAIGFLGLGVLLLVIALLFARRMWYHEMRLLSGLFTLGGIILLITCAAMAKPILLPAGEELWASLAKLPARLIQASPEPYRWLGDADTAMISLVIPMVWAGMGPGCLIYLAALKGIPEDYYEAADIDGATFIDKVLFVVFPILKPLILINFIGVFIGSWYGSTGRVLAMTGGGANTEVAGLHIFYKAFIFLKFGPATAMAWVLAVLLIGFTVYQLRILSRVEFRTTGGKA